MDETSTSFLDVNGTVKSTCSMISSTLPPLAIESSTTCSQQYVFNAQAPTVPKDSINENTRHSVSDYFYYLNRCFMDDHDTSPSASSASTNIFGDIDVASSLTFDTSKSFMTAPSFSAHSGARIQSSNLTSANTLCFSGSPNSISNNFSDIDVMNTAQNNPITFGTSFIAPVSTTNPTFTVSNIAKRAAPRLSLFPRNSTGIIDMISTVGTETSDISMIIPTSNASLISDLSTGMVDSSFSHRIIGESSLSSSMDISSTESRISSPLITTTAGLCPSTITSTTISSPSISTESQQSAKKMVELFVNHISVLGSESNQVSMSGLIKNAIPVRGLKMLRIRYELHSWWIEYKRHNPVPAIDLQKAFAFELLASEWFEDKLAAVLFMREMLLANQNLDVLDLEAIGAAFAAGHICVYKVCDHLSDKVLFNIAHGTSALTMERKTAIEKLFEWTRVREMWQSRAALCTLSHFADDESLRDRILMAALEIMRRPEDEAKSAAGAALRELSKFEMDKVLGALKKPDNIAATSVIALKKVCTNLTDSMVEELKEWRKDVITQRRSR